MSTLYRRGKSPYWWYSSGDGINRIRVSTGLTSKTDAKLIQKKWDRESGFLNHGIKVKKTKVKNLKNDYISHKRRRLAKSSVKRVKNGMENFCSFAGEQSINSITREQIESYIDFRKDRNASNKTIHSEVAWVLHGFFEFAIKRNYCSENPTKGADLPNKSNKRPVSSIPHKIILKAIATAKRDDDKLLWTTMYYTGLGSGDAGTITKENIKGKNLVIHRAKTGQPAYLPLHQKHLLPIKKSLIQIMPLETDRNNSCKRLKRIFEKLGYYGTPHSLRHSFNQRLAEKGVGIEDRRKLMGHALKTSTEGYTHADTNLARKYIDKL